MSTNNNMMDNGAVITRGERGLRAIVDISHFIVLLLSLLLIIYISYNTFKGIEFMDDKTYMTFQFWVCMVFLADFFLGFFISVDKKYYVRCRWFFFFISIPFLNIIYLFHWHFSKDVMFYLRFVPLIRGAYSLAMVIGYLSKDRALSLMTQYLAILLVLVYSLSLIFFYEEHSVNKNVHDFWDALYWAAMNCTTVGCYFAAVTPIGKIISVVLPTAGMMMLPLFTAFVTSRVRAFDQRREKLEHMYDLSAQRLAAELPTNAEAALQKPVETAPSPDQSSDPSEPSTPK